MTQWRESLQPPRAGLWLRSNHSGLVPWGTSCELLMRATGFTLGFGIPVGNSHFQQPSLGISAPQNCSPVWRGGLEGTSKDRVQPPARAGSSRAGVKINLTFFWIMTFLVLVTKITTFWLLYKTWLHWQKSCDYLVWFRNGQWNTAFEIIP